MSKADVLFVNMCKDILDNGFSSEGQAGKSRMGGRNPCAYD